MKTVALIAVLTDYRNRLLFYADQFSGVTNVQGHLLLAAQNIDHAIAYLSEADSEGASA